MENKKIIILAGAGESTNIIFNALNHRFGISKVIIEEKEGTKVFFKRRIRRLGLWTVLGQVIFQLIIVKLLKIFSKKRIQSILNESKLNTQEIPVDKTMFVKSINSSITLELIKKIEPDLIIVNGTRIISRKILQSTKCKLINTHAGITPMYRGVHGAYWALVNNDIKNIGVTVHYIDEGIDTGNIIAQSQIKIFKNDNFTTYPLLQLSIGLQLLVNSIVRYFNDEIVILQENGESKLYYHPTIWQYLYYRVKRNVK